MHEEAERCQDVKGPHGQRPAPEREQGSEGGRGREGERARERDLELQALESLLSFEGAHAHLELATLHLLECVGDILQHERVSKAV